MQVRWKARFASNSGYIVAVNGKRLEYRLDDHPNRRRHFRLAEDERPFLAAGNHFQRHQILAGQVEPLTTDASRCAGRCDMARLLASRERTVRFTGCKLARLAKVTELEGVVRGLAEDGEEDPYVRMEAKAYLCEVVGDSAATQFHDILFQCPDEQMRLEAVVTLAETRTPEAFELLRTVLQDTAQPLFLRSACAWGIGCHGTKEAAEVLIQAFADVASEIREEALHALQDLGAIGFDPLVKGLENPSTDIAAGVAEALRRIPNVPVERIAELAEQTNSTWPAWTLAHFPKEAVTPYVAALQSKRPEVHYAVSVLWNFLESWIAADWTPGAMP